MSAGFLATVTHLAGAAGRLLKRGAANTWRRLLILGRLLAGFWQQRRLNRAWRRLGREVHLALEAGELNPMLTEPVRDAVLKARDLKAAKDRQTQAVALLREKIRESYGPGAPPPGPEEPPERDTAARGE
jgi:hypothetical protein